MIYTADNIFIEDSIAGKLPIGFLVLLRQRILLAPGFATGQLALDCIRFGMIDDMIAYAKANAPLIKDLEAEEVGATAAFLLSPLASAITGTVLYVDNGMHAMGLATDSASLQNKHISH